MHIRENTLWTWLKRAKPIFRERLHMDRVENSCSKGMPDVEGCLDGAQFWLEEKSVKAPKDIAFALRIGFQPGQVEWIAKRIGAGGAAGFLIKVSGSGKRPRTYIVHGRYGAALERGVTEASLAILGKLVASPEDAIQTAITFMEV